MSENISLLNYEMQDYKKLYTVITPLPYPHLMPQMHWHPQYEVMLIRRGTYTLRNNRTEITRDGPSVFIHCPYSLHNLNTHTDSPYERDLIYIDRHMPGLFGETFLPCSVFTDASLLYALPHENEMREMHTLALQAADAREDSITGALYIAILLRKILSVIDSGRGETVRTDFSYVQDILRLISENLATAHTLQSLSHQYGVSVSKLQKDFSSVTGMSFHRYQTMIRLMHARDRLLAGESIIKTSLECGYCSESHFIKAFRTYWGMTPGMYLKNKE